MIFDCKQVLGTTGFTDQCSRGISIITSLWKAGNAAFFDELGSPAFSNMTGGLALCTGHANGAGLVNRNDTLVDTCSIATKIPPYEAADLKIGSPVMSLDVADTTRRGAATARAATCSIKSGTGDSGAPTLLVDQINERVQAADVPDRELTIRFIVMSRYGDFLCGLVSFGDMVFWLQAYARMSIHALYIGGHRSLHTFAAVWAGVVRSITVLVGGSSANMVVQLAAASARWFSLSFRTGTDALAVVPTAATAIQVKSSISPIRTALTYAESNRMQPRRGVTP